MRFLFLINFFLFLTQLRVITSKIHYDNTATLSFVFVERFGGIPGKWNGQTYRESFGMSGTHAASIMLAESLAQLGHNVRYISPNILPGTYKNVHYETVNPRGRVSCDFVITTFSAEDLQLIENAHISYKKLAVSMNNDWGGPLNYAKTVLQIPHNRLVLLDISMMQKWNCILDSPWTRNLEHRFLDNSIDLSEITHPVDMSIKKDQFVFFACFERGGPVAFNVAKHFPHFKFVSMNYIYGTDTEKYKKDLGPDPHNQIVAIHGGRNAVMKALEESKYFIYPLVAPNNNVHYDTFGYVVLEALLNGLIVILPHMSCFEELFGDAIAYVEVSDLLTNEEKYRWKRHLPQLNSETMLKRYIAKVEELEASESLRLLYVERAMQLRDRFDNVRIGREFSEYAHIELAKIANRERLDAEMYGEYDPHRNVTHSVLDHPNY
jgi:hypothetical protein